MANQGKTHRDLELAEWAKALRENELKAAFRKKGLWVFASPRSPAVWYSAVLSNLHCRYAIPEATTMDSVREALSHGFNRTAFERLKLVTDLSGETAQSLFRLW